MSNLREKRKVVQQFTKQIRDVWDACYPDPTIPFRMYLGFLRKYADPPGTRDKDKLALWTPWQIVDMEMCLYNPKINPERETLQTTVLRSRRSAKTRDGTTVANFWSVLGYDVGWRAPIGGQLAKAAFWFSRNPFVKDVRLNEREIRFISPLSKNINIAPLTPGSTKGGDCDCMFYDELGDVMKHLQAYLLYLQSRPMVANSDFRHITNFSTPWRDTAFQDEWDITKKLEIKYDTKLTSEHTADECPWLTPEFIESEKLNYPSWYIDAMYYCKWTVPYGAVFEKVITVGDPKYPHLTKEWLSKIKPQFIGVDFNAGDRDKPHYLLTLTYDPDYIYVLDEFQFTDLNFLFQERFRNYSMECEDGLWNTQFTEQTKSMGLTCIYFEWNESEKMERVQELRNRTIIIDKNRAPLTHKNLLNAAYDPNSRLVKLEKRTDQHGLDCLLHGVHPKGGKVYVPIRPDPYRGKVFAKQRILKV